MSADVPVSETPVKELPDVTVLVCTYDRYDLLVETIARLRENLNYPPEKLRYIICDDHSPGNYRTKLNKEKTFDGLNLEVVTTAKNGGWAANVNNGNAAVETDYTFFIEDDYHATATIELAAMAALMEKQPNIGMVRARGIAGTSIVAHLNEADISEYIPEWRDGVGLPGKLAYWQLGNGSPTPYLYSNGPHLKHRRFHEFYGDYPTGLLLGETEESYAHSVKDAMTANPIDAPAIAILPADVVMWFDHVGESYQHTPADKRNA